MDQRKALRLLPSERHRRQTRSVFCASKILNDSAVSHVAKGAVRETLIMLSQARRKSGRLAASAVTQSYQLTSFAQAKLHSLRLADRKRTLRQSADWPQRVKILDWLGVRYRARQYSAAPATAPCSLSCAPQPTSPSLPLAPPPSPLSNSTSTLHPPTSTLHPLLSTHLHLDLCSSPRPF